MKLNKTPSVELRVIQGGRQSLENEIMKQIAQGKICREALEKLKPKGRLYLVHSSPILSEQEESAWLDFEDLNL